MNLSSPRKKGKEGRNSAEANKVCFTMLKYQYISIKRVKKRKKYLTVSVVGIKVNIMYCNIYEYFTKST